MLDGGLRIQYNHLSFMTTFQKIGASNLSFMKLDRGVSRRCVSRRGVSRRGVSRRSVSRRGVSRRGIKGTVDIISSYPHYYDAQRSL